MIYKNVNGTQKLVTNIRKPKKWRRFEYLESTGTLWIDTNFTLNAETKIMLDFLYVTNRTSSRICGGTITNCELWWSTDNKFHFYANTGSNINTSITANFNRHTFIYDNPNLKAYIDNTSFTFNTRVTNPGFTLFKANNGSYNKAAAKIYECVIYINNNEVMHLIPCQYNEQYGMWDLVEDKFYGNKGTGTFTVGPEIPNYDEVEKIMIAGDTTYPKELEFYSYLLGDGAAYIDSGYLMNRNCSISITLQLTAKVNQARYVGILKSGCYILMYSGDSGANIKTYTKIASGGTYSTLIAHNTAIHTYYINDASHKSYIDGTSKVTHSDIPADNTYYSSCYLFWANGAAAGALTTARIYSCRIYDNGTLVRDFIPCTYNNEAGMWDKVEKQFYGNAGSGTFTLGTHIDKEPSRISDTLSLYDNTIYTEPDGSEWVHIFHHNNPASNLFASGNSFATQVHTSENAWFDASYCYKVPVYEFLIKLTLTSGGTEYKYRWILSINPMIAGFMEVPRSKVTYNESTGYTLPTESYGGLCLGYQNTYLRINTSATAWWGAIGSWTTYNGGIPSTNGLVVSTGCIDLYVRKFDLLRVIPVWVLKNALIKSSTNGVKDYIDTGINNYTMNNIRCYCEMSPSDDADTAFFGSRGSYYLFYKVEGNYFWPISKCETILGTLVAGHRYIVDWNKGAFTVTGEDGVYLSATRSSTTNNTGNLYIFNFNPTDTRTCEAKIYWFKIYIDDVLVRDYVPATMGGRPGLYDKVNHKMYFNANSSGNFTVE